MKFFKMIAVSVLVSIAAGCLYDGGRSVVTAERAGSKSFSDATYVWQDYQQSTNRADVIIK